MNKLVRKTRTSVSDRVREYLVEFKIQRDMVHDHCDDFGLLYEFSGEIIHESQDSEKRTVVGTIQGVRVGVGEAVNRGVSLQDACDSHSSNLMDYYETFFEPGTNTYREELEIDTCCGDLLIIDKITIDEQHRGMKLGLLALSQAILLMGGDGAAAIKPFPLQYEEKDDDGPAFQRDLRKLEHYWARLGFRRALGSEFFYMDLVRRFPTPEQIAGL